MRKLKFRYLWQGTWYYVDMYADNTALAYKEFESRNKTSHWLQFTGLLDKNGVEIYEGDIIHMDNQWKVEVVFGLHTIGKDDWDIPHESPMFCGKFKDGSGYTGLNFSDGYEVIGNIHQNPELL